MKRHVLTVTVVMLPILLVGAARAKVPKHTPSNWRRVHVGNVSFYVPPHLSRTGSPGNAGIIAAFREQHNDLYLYYAYGRHVPCTDEAVEGPTDLVQVLNGKWAQLRFRIRSEDELLANKKDRHVLNLCVLDVGDGKNKFEIYATSLDLDILKTLKQSFDDIDFR
jgi:hypothetical protein